MQNIGLLYLRNKEVSLDLRALPGQKFVKIGFKSCASTTTQKPEQRCNASPSRVVKWPTWTWKWNAAQISIASDPFWVQKYLLGKSLLKTYWTEGEMCIDDTDCILTPWYMNLNLFSEHEPFQNICAGSCWVEKEIGIVPSLSAGLCCCSCHSHLMAQGVK